MQEKNRRNRKKNSGFSMVELIVTVAILAIISVGAFIVSGSQYGWKLNHATERLDSALDKAMVQSMSKSDTAGLIVYELNGEYFAAMIKESCREGNIYRVTEDKVVEKYSLGKEPLTITLSYKGKDGTAVSDVTLINQSSESNISSAAEFLYDRSTGAIKTVKVNSVESYYTGINLKMSDREAQIKVSAATGKHEIQ